VEKQVKERLVGAAVLIAIAVLLIPELLSGPRSGRSTVDPASEDGRMRSYTIDLTESAPRTQATARNIDTLEMPREPARPPVESTADEAGERAALQSASDEAIAPASAAEAPPRVVAPEPAAKAPVATAPAPAPPVRKATSASGNWAVQVGSFANRTSAGRLADDLSRRGYRSFITEFRSGGKTLHRVRIGPMATRAQADAAMRKLKSEGTTATVVAAR
jgi:DedD protein